MTACLYSISGLDAFVVSPSQQQPFVSKQYYNARTPFQSQAQATTLFSSSSDLAEMGKKLTDAMIATDLFKDTKVTIAPSSTNRLGLFASNDLKSNEVALSIPFEDQIILTASNCQKNTNIKDFLPDNYDGWTGDAGLIAMELLYELARSVEEDNTSAKFLPRRNQAIQDFMSLWVQSLPYVSSEGDGNDDTAHGYSHPISTWNEETAELLQYSSTKKIFRILDDIEEDAAWWEEKVWSKHRDVFPATVVVSGTTRDCFSESGFKWAMTMVNSRSIFVDGMLRLVPIADYANHYEADEKDSLQAQEIQSGFFGAFGTSKGIQIRSPINEKKKGAVVVTKGNEIHVSYGPKTPIDYLLEHGFLPKNMITVASQKQQKSLSNRSKSTTQRGLCEVAELTFEIPDTDRFYDDKLDILEFETPLGNPTQSFDVTSVDNPDPVMIQFLRLMKLEGMDAFLLESIFRKEVWDFMGLPVSEKNEEMVVKEVASVCKSAMEDMKECSSAKEDEEKLLSLATEGTVLEAVRSSPELLCSVVRVLERRALSETMLYMEREGEALDLKEYYQERRLKDLGLDSEWNDEDSDPDVGWGQTRAPGSGDLDW